MALTFHLKIQQSAFFLQIRSNKPVFWEDLTRSCSKDFAHLLLKEKRKWDSGRLETLRFSEVPISLEVLWRALKYAGEVYYGAKKKQVDPEPYIPFFTVLEERERGCVVDYVLQRGGVELRPDRLLLARPLVFLAGGIVGTMQPSLTHAQWALLEAGPAYIRHFYEEEVLFVRKETEARLCLQMGDPYGKFWHLLLKNSIQGEEMRSSNKDRLRQKAEQDLFDLGWTKTREGFALSPSDLFASLDLLVSVGWEVLDKGGRPLLFCEDASCKIVGDALFIQSPSLDKEHDAAPFLQAAKAGSSFLFLHDKEERSTVLLEHTFQKRIQHLDAYTFEEEQTRIDERALGFFQEEDDLGQLAPSMRSLLFPPSITPERFQGKLYPYQEKGVAWMRALHDQGWGGLLADEMGLGKTVQVLAFLASLSEGARLVVAPAHLVYHWQKEARTFLGKEPYLHIGGGRESTLEGKTLIITSYATLVRDAALFEKSVFATVVLDESSYVKNPRSVAFSVLSKLQKQSAFALNGTPIDNAYEELWAQFTCLDSRILGPKQVFLPKARVDQEKAVLQLRPFLCKRTKQEVHLDLPPLTVQDVLFSLGEEHRSFYEAKKASLRKEAPSALEILLRLRQSALAPALVGGNIPSDKISLLLQDLEQLKGCKVLIFSSFTQFLRLVERELIGKKIPTLYLDGKLSLREREKTMQAFCSSSDGVCFLLSMKAAGIGLNLPQADVVFLLDPWWNESLERQAMARAHRIGRKGALLVKRYIAKETIEENILELKKEKLLYNQLIDSSITREDCLHLFC